MIVLDPSKLASVPATLILRRGAGVPLLVWEQRADQGAKKTLDEISDDKLLDRETIANESMVTAVRAMLYLWNGWIGDCRMYAQGAPGEIAHYLDGLCARQKGNVDAAKSAFRKVEANAIYAPLAEYMKKEIPKGSEAALDRFAQMVKLGETWEPFAFIDLVELARAEKVSQATNHVVCRLQCIEFELLFIEAYSHAVGEHGSLRQVADAPVQRRHKKRKISPTRRSQRRPHEVRDNRSEPEEPAEESNHPAVAAAPAAVVRIQCPACRVRLDVPESSRGRKARCSKCGAAFLIPTREASPV